MDVFSALADPLRRGLLIALADGPTRVVDLAAEHPVSRPAVSKHLRVLGEAGLVSAEDRGRERHYTLNRAALDPVEDLLNVLRGPAASASVRSPLTTQALDALDTEVRRARRDRRRGAATPHHEETA